MNECKFSTKDLSYIEDIFNWNKIVVTKYELYIDLLENEEIIKKITELKEMHNEFCKILIDLLEKEICNEG